MLIFLQVGKNRAEASLDRLQNLNPMVQVSAEVGDVDAKDREYFKNYDIVLVTSAMKDTLIKVNGFCRDLGIKFLSGDVFGFFGYAFMDLVEHEFVEEVMKVRYF